MSTLFEKVVRQKLRFQSTRGALSVEDLYDVPLTSRNGFSLDDIAKKVNKELQASTEESFVAETSSINVTAELKMEVIKHVISVIKEERKIAQDSASKAEKKRKIQSLIAQKQDEEMAGQSLEDLQTMLDSL